MGNGYIIYTCSDGTDIIIEKGSKIQSKYDFKVRYKSPGKRTRTPKHIHWVIDLYIKLQHAPSLTMQLIDYFINITKRLKQSRDFPPVLQFFNIEIYKKFRLLDNYGEYKVDFLLIVIELIMIQEKTNYPTGTMNLRLLEKFRKDDSDIFSVVSKATFNRR